MNNEKLERLKKVLSGTEFETEATSIYRALAPLKDIWEGVEFVECETDKAFNFKEGKIYRLAQGRDIDGIICIYNECGGKETPYSSFGLGGTKRNFNPSTKEAYVNQLKAKAFELYGDIQNLDRFEEPTSNIDTYRAVDNFVNPEWDYVKHDDELFFYSILLYKNGKWAKKLPKRIEVKFDGGNVPDQSFFFIYIGPAREKLKSIGYNETGEFLADQLEKYLNDEVD